MVKIAISGFHGTGKSTVGKSLAEKLNLKHYSTGDAFRSLAKEKDMSLKKFSVYVENNPEIDEMLDQKVINKTSKHKNIVVDSLLSGYLLNNIADFKVLLTAPLKTRIRRMTERDDTNYKKKLSETKFREQSEIERFKELYDIDLEDETLKREIFDLIIETQHYSVEEIADMIIAKMKERAIIE